MPVILERGDEEDWLNPQLGAQEPKALLVPYLAEEMDAYEVSRKVNSVRYNDDGLVRPV